MYWAFAEVVQVCQRAVLLRFQLCPGNISYQSVSAGQIAIFGYLFYCLNFFSVRFSSRIFCFLSHDRLTRDCGRPQIPQMRNVNTLRMKDGFFKCTYSQ